MCIDLNNVNTPSGTYIPNWPTPRVCPTCHQCPTCGQYSYPLTYWVNGTTLTSGQQSYGSSYTYCDATHCPGHLNGVGSCNL